MPIYRSNIIDYAHDSLSGRMPLVGIPTSPDAQPPQLATQQTRMGQGRRDFYICKDAPGGHPAFRPGTLLVALLLVLLMPLLAACGGTSSSSQHTPTPSATPDNGPQLLAKAGLAFNMSKTLHGALDISVMGSGVDGMVNTEVWNEAPNKSRTVVLQSTLAQLTVGEITVSDGKQVWQYDPAKQVVYHASLSGTNANTKARQDTNQFLLGVVRSIFSSSDATLVSSTASVKGHAVYDVHVQNKFAATSSGTSGANGEQFNYSGDVYLDKTSYLPVEVALAIQGFGQATIDLPTLVLNKPVDEKLFTFVPPAGVKVLPFPANTGESGSLTLAEAQQQAGYHLLSIPTSQAAYALQSVDALGAPGNQIYTLNYTYNGSTKFAISEGKALANLPTSGQAVRVRGTSGTIATEGNTTTLAWTEHGVGVQIAGELSSSQLMAIAGLLA